MSQNNQKLDSLLQLEKTAKNDSVLISVYDEITKVYQGNDIDKFHDYIYKIFSIAKKTQHPKHLGLAYFKEAIYKNLIGEYDSCKFYNFKTLEVIKNRNYYLLEANTHSNLGSYYTSIANFENGLSEFLLAIKLFEKNNNVQGVANTKNRMGIIYLTKKDYKQAEKYFSEAANLLLENYQPGTLGNPYLNLGIIKSNQEKYEESNSYYRKALKEYEYIKQIPSILKCYNNLYINFINLNQVDSAFYYNKLINVVAKRDYIIDQLYLSYINFSILNQRFLIKPQLAPQYLDSARSINEIFKLPEYAAVYFQEKATYEFAYGDKKKAFVYMDRFLNIKDSLLSLENSEIVHELNAKYETEKKDLQIKQQTSDLQLKASESKRKSIIIWLGLAALIGTGFFGAMAFINFKKAKKANIIIENQKLEVELKNKEITQQKELVDEKQKEIIDSINYAKRIQSAVLTGEEVWNKVSKEHFILFKPKDIVSGDFYWAYNTPNNRSVFVLADCTGHGVPGGFMSMLGNSFLNEIVVENKLFKADEILNKLRNKIINALEQKGGTQQKDGMDMVLCVWNKIDNTLEFAGANNPLWILREEKMTEYKASKMPIGAYTENLEPFTSVTIQLQKGDIIYMITDGYADQFGGPKGKKFKYKPLQEILIQNKNVSMSEQKIVLENALNQWKENYEQIDDISLIGVRV